ncbi:hypothetical protein [Shimia biformata]|uniref:hypothetical protein n=1 Tax=Shimia biformata TaxID=1294299 RepID=UPI00194DC023|nr:hypothetical protein [Shimia biformata]
MKRPFAATLIAATLATPVLAADLDGCQLTNKDFNAVVAPALQGEFTAKNGKGVMVLSTGAKSLTEPVPAKGSQAITMVMQDGKLYAKVGNAQAVEVRIVRGNPTDYGVKFEFHPGQDENAPSVVMDADAMGTAPACGPSEIMRIQFGGKLTDSDGGARDYSFILHMVNEDLLSGVMNMDGTQGENSAQVRRLITLKRN